MVRGDAFAALLSRPADDAHVDAVLSRVKTWLLRTGGEIAVREAERVGEMAVLSGISVTGGHAAAVSVPIAEVAARAA